MNMALTWKKFVLGSGNNKKSVKSKYTFSFFKKYLLNLQKMC